MLVHRSCAIWQWAMSLKILALRPHIAFLVVLLPGVMAAGGSGEDEFAVNVFTDLAPLLALFGEQFARQFISESLTWLDHIIFAMVPLGIITAIIGAIRVSGPPWARAFIGRARETRATAELELLSSTSREVCEVFNGRGVVRTLGTPKLTQLIIFPGICLHDDSTCGIHTLQSAYESQPSMLDKGDFGIKSSWDSEKMPKTDNTKIAGGTAGTVKKKSTFTSRVSAGQSEPVNHDPEKGEVPVNPIHEGTTDDNIGRVRESSESPPTSVREFPPELKGAAPNLQLNLPMTSPSHRKSLEELWWAAAVALVIQMAVTIISAVTTFHGPTRKTVGRPQAEYWFWFFIGGTVCLNLSMMLCSWIIEKRTREYVWRANSETKIDYISDKTAKYNSAEELIKENQEAKATGTATTEQLTFSPYHASAEMELKYKNETSGSPSSWRQMKLFWLQQKHTVNDQDFDAFLILGGNKIEILTSSIPPTDASKQFPPWMHRIATEKFELLAILAALFGMAGFILQFEGLRGLAWPTAVAQLVAILFMALVRAVVRRRLGTPLSTIPATAGHELDWLSLRLVFDDAPLASHRDADDSETATLVPQWRISTHDILEAELPGAKDTTRDATGDTTDQPDTEKSKLPQRHLARRGKLEKRKRQSNENRSKRPTVTVPDQIDDTIADEADNIESRKKATKTHQRDRHGPLPQSFARLRGNDLARPLFPQSSEMLLKVRRRLGELTKCRGTASKEAIALSQAISLTLAELCPLQKDEIGTFTWSFDAIMTKIPLRQAKIYRGEDGHKFKEKRVDTGTSANLANVFDTIFDEIQLQADFDGYGWKIPPPDLDAILSLWMSHDSFSTPDTEDPLENWKPPGAPTNKSRVGLTPNLRSKSSDVRSDWLTKLASETVKYRRILGENPPHYNPEGSSSDDNTSMRTDILTRDLNWWTSDSRIVSMDTGHWTGVNTDEESLALSSTGAVKVAIGFNGLEPQASTRETDFTNGEYIHKISGTTPWVEEQKETIEDRTTKTGNESDGVSGEVVSMVSSGPLAGILAQHLFSGFMWALSAEVDPDRISKVTIEDSELFDDTDFDNTWNLPTLRNKRIMKLARDIEGFGLGRVEDILLAIVPPLSFHGSLPSDAMMGVLTRKTKDYEKYHDWAHLKNAYTNLLRLNLYPRRMDRISYEVVVELIEFLLLAKEGVDGLQMSERAPNETANTQNRALQEAVERITEQLAKHELLLEAAQKLRWFFKRQGRLERVDNLALDTLMSDGRSNRLSIDERPDSTLLKIAKFGDRHEESSTPRSKEGKSDKPSMELIAKPDIFGWYPLHYAAVLDDNYVFRKALEDSNGIDIRHHVLKDRSGRTPLHYAAMHREVVDSRKPPKIAALTGRLEIATSAASVAGRDGMMPIHCAARYGTIHAFDFLSQHSDLAAVDAFGRSPLHLGVLADNKPVVQSCLRKVDNVIVRTGEEQLCRTALHLAIIHNRQEIMKDILRNEQHLKAMTIRDDKSVTPIQLLVDKEDCDTVFSEIFHNFPRPTWDAGPGKSQSVAAECLREMLEVFVQVEPDKHTILLTHLFESIIKKDWGTQWIAEAFSIAYRLDRLGMISVLLKILRSLSGENVPRKGPAIENKQTGSPTKDSTTNHDVDHADIDTSESHGASLVMDRSDATDRPQSELELELKQHLKTQLNIEPLAVLIWAICHGHQDLYREFIEDFLQISDNVDWTAKDPDNRSPLAYIAKVKSGSKSKEGVLTMKKRKRMLRLLWGTWDHAKRAKALNTPQGRYHKTPLMYAAKNGLTSLVRTFVDNGALVTAKDNRQHTALFVSLTHTKKSQEKIWDILIERSPEIVNERTGIYGAPPLVYAIGKGRRGIVEYLSRQNFQPDPNLLDNEGDSPLAYCVMNKSPHMIVAMLKNFPHTDVHQRNEQGLSPLMRAYRQAFTGRRVCLEKLLSLARIDMQGYEVTLMLSHAVFRGHIELVDILLKSGGDPMAIDDSGRSVLFLAALHGSVAMFEKIWNKTDKERSGNLLGLAYYACAYRRDDVGEKIAARVRAARIEPTTCDLSGWTMEDYAFYAHKGVLVYSHNPSKKAPSSWAIRDSNPFFSACGSGNRTLELKGAFPKNLSELVRDHARVLVRANHCIPLDQTLYFWELEFLSHPQRLGKNCEIAIGICSQRFDPYVMPGWPGSGAYGYHSDDGGFYTGGHSQDPNLLLPAVSTYGPGDTVGCLVDVAEPSHRTIQFTHNGVRTGKPIRLGNNMRGPLFPCVGFRAGPESVGMRVRATFDVPPKFGLANAKPASGRECLPEMREEQLQPEGSGSRMERSPDS